MALDKTKLFFLLAGPERCIFFGTCKRIFTGIPKVGGGRGVQLYVFTAFPNGLACCPKLFTKLLKPVMAHLHMLGFVSTIFLLMGDSEKECVQNVKSSLALFKSLGFVVHPTKSVLIPLHKIAYLGFEIDSQRENRKLSTASKLLTGTSSTVRELAQFVGQVVSCFQGVRVKFERLWHHKITYIGFETDSQSMTVVPTLERKRGILSTAFETAAA